MPTSALFDVFLRVSQKGCVLSARQWRGNSFLVSQVVLVSIGLLSEVQLLGDRAEVALDDVEWNSTHD